MCSALISWRTSATRWLGEDRWGDRSVLLLQWSGTFCKIIAADRNMGGRIPTAPVNTATVIHDYKSFLHSWLKSNIFCACMGKENLISRDCFYSWDMTNDSLQWSLFWWKIYWLGKTWFLHCTFAWGRLKKKKKCERFPGLKTNYF